MGKRAEAQEERDRMATYAFASDISQGGGPAEATPEQEEEERKLQAKLAAEEQANMRATTVEDLNPDTDENVEDPKYQWKNKNVRGFGRQACQIAPPSPQSVASVSSSITSLSHVSGANSGSWNNTGASANHPGLLDRRRLLQDLNVP